MTVYIIFLIIFNIVTSKILVTVFENQKKLFVFGVAHFLLIATIIKIYNLLFKNPLVPGLSLFILLCFSWSVTMIILIKSQINIFKSDRNYINSITILITTFQVIILLTGAIYSLK